MLIELDIAIKEFIFLLFDERKKKKHTEGDKEIYNEFDQIIY